MNLPLHGQACLLSLFLLEALCIKVNCGGIPESLMDSELFGHEKGAFTGADSRKPGRFERANGGTIFLDEVGELSRDAQVKLLRVLQNKEIERVGGSSIIKVDIRVISATNRDMKEMVRQGNFREDLWFRLNVLPITIPPLRLRKQDIPALVNHIIERKRREMNLARIPVLTNSQFGELAAYHWPGNVRELENIIERWLIVGDTVGSFIQLINHEFFLTQESRVEPDSEDPDIPGTIMPMNDLIIEHIQMAVKASNGKIGGMGGAAEKLGMHSNTLRSRMLKLGIIRKKNNR
ncbi:MAG: sigma 54-interacting transcriptional regulator [Desulfobacterium sp.]